MAPMLALALALLLVLVLVLLVGCPPWEHLKKYI